MDQALKALLADLKRGLGVVLSGHPFELILFGSRARGDFSADSDVDVAVIVDGLTPKLKSLVLTEIANVELDYLQPLSALVFSREDFSRLWDRERCIALDIRAEGVSL